MAFTRVEVDAQGQSTLHYQAPGKPPATVWVLRGLVVVLLLIGVMNAIVLLGLFGRMDDQVGAYRERLYQESTYEFDTTVDGRWRYCRENPDMCVVPWGATPFDECVECLSGGSLDGDAFDSSVVMSELYSSFSAASPTLDESCGCRDLFLPFGWGDGSTSVEAPAVAFAQFVPTAETPDGRVLAQEPFFDIRGVCQRDDDDCWVDFVGGAWTPRGNPAECGDEADVPMGDDVPVLCYDGYPLYSQAPDAYTADMMSFLTREVLKVLNVALGFVSLALMGLVAFLVVRWALVLVVLGKGTPRAHHQLIRTGIIQIVVEFLKIFLIVRLTAVSYPFAGFADGMGVRLFPMLIAIAAIGVALLPPTRRYFSFHRFVPEGAAPTA